MKTMRLSWIGAVIFFFSAISFAGAETVLLYSSSPVGKGDFELSKFYMEDGIMDVFFEAGHIIFNGSFQNTGVELSEDATFGERTSYRMAKAGGASHLLEIALHFSEDEAETLPLRAGYRLVEIEDERNLAEGEVAIDEAGDASEMDDREMIRQMGKIVGLNALRGF